MVRPAWLVASALALGLAGFTPASAQTYPNKPIHLVVSFLPGIARHPPGHSARSCTTVSAASSIENKPGGNDDARRWIRAHAAPDGYTLYLALDTTLTQAPAVYANTW